jgi:hypothetical protein
MDTLNKESLLEAVETRIEFFEQLTPEKIAAEIERLKELQKRLSS